jgi:hypothetical protein
MSLFRKIRRVLSQKIRRFFGVESEELTLETAKTASDIRMAAISYLRTHRKWYARWSRFYSVTWNVATMLIVLLGALSSILTAAQRDFPVPSWVLITLPAVSSLLAALLIQFKLKDSCRVREAGRIASEELICRAYLIPTDDPKRALEVAVGLREAAHQLEREQLIDFLAENARP